VAAQDDIKPGQVEVIEGFTTAVQVPEKVDYLVGEIIGCIGSEENAIATIRDAQERFMKNPKDPYAYIPHKIQTFAAPVSYALHPVLAPPRFEKLKGVPLRVNCRDKGVSLLADPQMIEEFTFDKPPAPGRMQTPAAFTGSFTVDAKRIQETEQFLYESLMKEAEQNKEDVKQEEFRKLAKETANSFSGMAMWPKLLLDPAGDVVVDSRGPLGEPQKSHWQTLLSLMSPVPVPLKAGDVIQVKETAELARDVTSPVKYTLDAEIKRA
jgi:hypothetical protein